MVAIINQEKVGVAQNQKLFTLRKKNLPEIIYVTFMLSYVHEQQTLECDSNKAIWENNVFTTPFKAILIVHKC